MPLGTGKTTTIAAAVDYWHRYWNPVWIITQSNVGVKNIARSLVGKNFQDFKLLVSKEFHFEWYALAPSDTTLGTKIIFQA